MSRPVSSCYSLYLQTARNPQATKPHDRASLPRRHSTPLLSSLLFLDQSANKSTPSDHRSQNKPDPSRARLSLPVGQAIFANSIIISRFGFPIRSHAASMASAQSDLRLKRLSHVSFGPTSRHSSTSCGLTSRHSCTSFGQISRHSYTSH